MPRSSRKKGIKRRTARIVARGEATGAEARRLARKRAASYQKRKAATGLRGPGKKGSISRQVFRHGTRADAKALKTISKKDRGTIKRNARSMKRINKRQGRTNQQERISELRSYVRRRDVAHAAIRNAAGVR